MPPLGRVLEEFIACMEPGQAPLKIPHERCERGPSGKCPEQNQLQLYGQNHEIEIRVLHIGKYQQLWVLRI